MLKNIMIFCLLIPGLATASSLDWGSIEAQLKKFHDLEKQNAPWTKDESPLVLLSFSYAKCKKVCPHMTVKKLKELQTFLDKKEEKYEIILVSLDPENDTPVDVAAFRKRNEIESSRWRFLAADLNTTKTLAKQVGVEFWVYHDHVMHDFRILAYRSGKLIKDIDWEGRNTALTLP